MFLVSIFLPPTLLLAMVLASMIPSEASISYVVEIGMASPKPSINTASDYDTIETSISSTSKSPSSTTIITTTMTISSVTTASPRSVTEVVAISSMTDDPSGIWIPDTETGVSTSTYCADKTAKHTLTALSTFSTCTTSTKFKPETKTHTKPKHSNIPPPCTVHSTLPFPTGKEFAHPYDVASKRHLCTNRYRLLRRIMGIGSCTIPEPMLISIPGQEHSTGPCMAYPIGTGSSSIIASTSSSSSSSLTTTSKLSSLSSTLSSSASSTPDFKTMAHTTTLGSTSPAAESYLTTLSSSAGASVASTSQVPVSIQTFAAVPEEEMTGELIAGKRPACGTGRGGMGCPAIDDGM
ncbi:hypothetical protein VTL71DRAFT_15286 [Oculimacula yallundae]|uniref:Uncharacterized protein n=1 Tax=Oculimacula yallundae TaxID=86028 RepID=A0ABR4CIC9_9HELO